jgi:putative transposase
MDILKPLPERRSIRLKGFDYSVPNGYFITICTYRRQCILGNVIDDNMIESEYGRMIRQWWGKLSDRYAIMLDEFIIMSNHIHGIIFTQEADAGARTGAPLQQIVRWFKTMTTNEYFRMIPKNLGPVKHLWQRNYYEHVIRGDEDLRRAREYIQNNPAQWTLDKENPDHLP